MGYGYNVPFAAEAATAERAGFIRRTYAHLAGAILAFVALETVLLQLPGVDRLISVMAASRLSWLVVLGLFIAVGRIAEAWAKSDMSPGMQYLGLLLYVVAESVVFLPLLHLAAFFASPDVIPTAGILTLAVFGGLTLAVFVTGEDFSYLKSVLAIGSVVALGLVIASLLIGFNLGTLFALAMVVLLSGYILYYTSNILYHYRTDQHVAASLALFASVATMFWYMLMIVMRGRD